MFETPFEFNWYNFLPIAILIGIFFVIKKIIKFLKEKIWLKNVWHNKNKKNNMKKCIV